MENFSKKTKFYIKKNFREKKNQTKKKENKLHENIKKKFGVGCVDLHLGKGMGKKGKITLLGKRYSHSLSSNKCKNLNIIEKIKLVSKSL